MQPDSAPPSDTRPSQPADEVSTISSHEVKQPLTSTYETIMSFCIRLIDRGVVTRDDKCISRAIRRFSKLRRCVDSEVLTNYCAALGVFQMGGDRVYNAWQEIVNMASEDGNWRSSTTTDVVMDEPSKDDGVPKESTGDPTGGTPPPSTNVDAELSSNQSVTQGPKRDNKMPASTQLGQAIPVETLAKHICPDALPHIQLWLCILAVVYGIDSYSLQTAKTQKRDTNRLRKILPLSQVLTENLLMISSGSRLPHPPDVLYAKALYYYVRPRDMLKEGVSLIDELILHYRQAATLHLNLTKACAINWLLKIYLDNNMPDAGIKFISKAVFPDQLRAPAQVSRYLFFMGRLKALSLEYADGYDKIMQALRKVPPARNYAHGFKLQAYKHAIIVEMLMGDIPSKDLFNLEDMKEGLAPYEELVRAVREGDLSAFREVLRQYRSLFEADGLLNLVGRLHYSVIRAGLRRINVAYSRIALADVAEKLGLESAEDAEGVVAKAIADQIVEAEIDHDQMCLISLEKENVYLTSQPFIDLHRRTVFCQSLCQESVKARQFASDEDQGFNADAERQRQEKLEMKDVGDTLNNSDLDLA